MTDAAIARPMADVFPAGLTSVERALDAVQHLPARHWARTYAVQLIAVDIVASVIAWVAAWWSLPHAGASMLAYGVGCAALGAVWLVMNHNHGAYQVRVLSTGTAEFLRVGRASATIAGGIAIAGTVFAELDAQRLVLVAVPAGTAMMVTGRYACRRAVHRRRLRGNWTSSIVAVGNVCTVRHLVEAVNRVPVAGLVVVGACVEDAPLGSEIAPGVPVLGRPSEAGDHARSAQADVVAVAGGTEMGPQELRTLGWSLEGSGCSLVMAPALTGVAGPRIKVSPVEGLPLVWVDEPRVNGYGRVLKRVMDVTAAVMMLALLSPVLLVVAALVKATSDGPVLFRQRRLGKGGEWVNVIKFRTMYVDAEERLQSLLHMNESSSVLFFKMRQDPRVTRVGQVLRKYSLDEIPQLFNVIGGRMSLVGPRPLPGDIDLYDGDFKRRMLVKPGLTGLWQVSGRSDLPVEDAVRLDLYYVENWSLALDIAIVLRTVRVVLRRRGAY